MKKSDELKQLRQSKIEAANTIIESAENEKREAFNKDEQARYDALKKEISGLDVQIARAEDIEEMQKRAADVAAKGGAVKTASKEERELHKYSILKAVRELTTGGLSGLEKEMHEEAISEARNSGVTVSGLGIPNLVWNSRNEKRAAIVATSSDAIVEQDGGFIEALRNKSRVLQLGARFMGGLVGDVRMPKQTTAGGLTWEGETDAAAESGAAMGGITMTPNRGSAYTDVSKQFLNQSSFSAEMILRDDLLQAVAVGIDAAAINGSGASNQPQGILQFSGLNTVAIGTNGGAPTWAKIVELESAIDTANTLDGALNYLMTPVMRGKLKTTSRDAGSGIFIWNGTEVNGYNAYTSNNVPSALTKGTSSDCHAILFGDFSQLLIGQWGGVDLVVDPYTLATSGKVRLVVNVFVDVKARHEAAFAAIKDARNV